MQMTDAEICASYRYAKYKKRQIRILADLNLTTPTEIKTILSKCGLSIKKEPSKRGISQANIYNDKLCKRYIKLADAGFDAKQIALELGVTTDTAKNFLKRHKIITAQSSKNRKKGENGENNKS